MALTQVRAGGVANDAVTTAKLPAGTILQVKNFVKQGNQTLSTSYAAVTGCQSGDITAIGSSSKFLIFGTVVFGGGDVDWSNAIKLYHRADSGTLADVTAISSNHKSGSNDSNAIGGSMWDGATYQQFVQAPATFSFLHTPSYTSTVTYEIFAKQLRSGRTGYVNRMGITDDQDYNFGSSSQLTILEIAG